MNLVKKKIYIIISIVCAVFSGYSNAIGMSAFRIYLDQDNPQTDFIIYNHNTLPQECQLRLRHYTFDDAGKMTEYKGEEPLDNSAESWVRFSPRKFTLTPQNNQTVKFVMRRKARSEAAEYRSYVSIDCGVEIKSGDDSKKEMISIAPKLVHNLPIIVRTGKLDATLNISNVNIKDGNVYFRLNRTGNRSVYGDVQLIEKSTGDVISEQKTLSLYTETSHSDFHLNLQNKKPAGLMLRFTENKAFGGTLIAEKDL